MQGIDRKKELLTSVPPSEESEGSVIDDADYQNDDIAFGPHDVAEITYPEDPGPRGYRIITVLFSTSTYKETQSPRQYFGTCVRTQLEKAPCTRTLLIS